MELGKRDDMFPLTMRDAGIRLDFVIDALRFEVFSSLLEDLFGKELVISWLLH